jgi:hypothetical protein
MIFKDLQKLVQSQAEAEAGTRNNFFLDELNIQVVSKKNYGRKYKSRT